MAVPRCSPSIGRWSDTWERCLRVREAVDGWQARPPRLLADASGASGGGRIGVFFASLAGGGIEKMMLTTAAALHRRGYEVDVLVAEAAGPLAGDVPEGVRLLELQCGPAWLGRARILQAEPPTLRTLLGPLLLALKVPNRVPYLPSLVRYFREERPRAVFAAGLSANLLALWARDLARSDARVVASQCNHMSSVKTTWTWKRRYFPDLIRRSYRTADAIVAVSEGVADDLTQHFGIPRDLIRVVYNPVVADDLREKAGSEIGHPWFAAGAPPVVLGTGRLQAAKDYPTLIRAFARLRRLREARLVILGNGRDPGETARRRAELMGLAAELGVAGDLDLPGFVPNPFPYMARASVFVLSSAWEGFGNVIVEALACGCPVVSTDCPSGPAEILDDGRYGRLVPVGDVAAMAEAIVTTLEQPPDRELLRDRGALFSVERAIDAYLNLLLPAPERRNLSEASA
jgi:glycosyltransferase involved in cell wall biosynthesis